jgi:hypothetical protein
MGPAPTDAERRAWQEGNAKAQVLDLWNAWHACFAKSPGAVLPEIQRDLWLAYNGTPCSPQERDAAMRRLEAYARQRQTAPWPVNDFRAHLRRLQSSSLKPWFVPGGFDHLTIGPYELSVQAGQHHYSNPREVVPVGRYTHWEVALFSGDKWLLADDPVFTGLAIAARLEETEDTCIAPYVPTAEVQALWERLCALALFN